MINKKDLKIGDKIKHSYRKNKYQKCTVIEILKGCNGSIKVLCEDGFYGGIEESTFPIQDIEKVNY